MFFDTHFYVVARGLHTSVSKHFLASMQEIADNKDIVEINSFQSRTNVCTGQEFVEQLSSSKQVGISEIFAHKLQRIRPPPGFCHAIRRNLQSIWYSLKYTIFSSHF